MSSYVHRGIQSGFKANLSRVLLSRACFQSGCFSAWWKDLGVSFKGEQCLHIPSSQTEAGSTASMWQGENPCQKCINSDSWLKWKPIDSRRHSGKAVAESEKPPRAGIPSLQGPGLLRKWPRHDMPTFKLPFDQVSVCLALCGGPWSTWSWA